MSERKPFYIGSPPKTKKDWDGSQKRTVAGIEVPKEERKIEGEFSEIHLIEPIGIEPPEFISSGYFGKVYKEFYKIVENGEEVILAKKEFKSDRELTSDKIIKTFGIQSRLKKVGIPVLDLYTDGKSIYSPFLNRDGVIAVSANNLISSYPERGIANLKKSLLDRELIIQNLSEVLYKILDTAIKLKSANILLRQDCLFFLLKESTNSEDITVDFLVGDFDLLEVSYKQDLSYESLITLGENFFDFIKKYTYNGVKQGYLKQIQEKLNPTLKIDQVFTQNGVKNTSDLDFSNDFIFKRGKITRNTTDQQLAQIISKQTDKEYRSNEIARTIEKITEETRYYIGHLENGDEDILNNRKSPLHIEGEVYFRDSTSLVTIPEGASFGGRADFTNCIELSEEDIERLKQMKVKGEIIGILVLPDGKIVS